MNVSVKTPAERIIAKFGVPKLCLWTGRHRSRVHAWAWPTGKGGTGGAVPLKVRPAIIEGAATEGETLTHADFEPAAGEAYHDDTSEAHQ
jgi:hypothetical protein